MSNSNSKNSKYNNKNTFVSCANKQILNDLENRNKLKYHDEIKLYLLIEEVKESVVYELWETI